MRASVDGRFVVLIVMAGIVGSVVLGIDILVIV
jgi:hypothetical protein